MIENVVPTNESGPWIDALLIEPPVPTRIPPSVEEPVPPNGTERVVVPVTTPVALVQRREFWILETVRLLVERLVVLAFVPYNVPLAEIFVVDAPPLKVCSCDQVLAVVVPKPRLKMPVDES